MSTRLSVSEVRHRIETFFEDRELDVVCRKKKYVYSIYWADDHEPLVRFRLTGRRDHVDVCWWNRDRWATVTDLGGAVPLDEALQYVSEDPRDLFFDSNFHDDTPSDSSRGSRRSVNAVSRPFLALHTQLKGASFLGGAIGALLPGCWSAMACGAAVSSLLFLLFNWFTGPRLYLKRIWLPVLLCSAVSALGGAIGGAANAAVGGGTLGSSIGAVVAFLACILLTVRAWTSWCIGFLAALTAAVSLTTGLGVRDHFLGILAAAFCATLVAHICAVAAAFYLRVARTFIHSAGPSLARDA